MTSKAELVQLLSDGLDLCVRARQMAEMDLQYANRGRTDIETRSATIPLWAEDEYQKNLAAWEARARAALGNGLPADAGAQKSDGVKT